MTTNWLNYWERNDIAFHLNAANPLLEKYWPILNIAVGQTIFVPLCGKTLDLLWLANAGYNVVGIELSNIACEAFFVENNLSFMKVKEGEFICYHNDNIKLYCGDFFKLSAEIIPSIAAVYDRAALIALPDELRKIYASHLATFVPTKGKMLLITLESPDVIQGPPYPVSHNEVQQLFGTEFQVKELAQFADEKISDHLHKKGYMRLSECIYELEKL